MLLVLAACGSATRQTVTVPIAIAPSPATTTGAITATMTAATLTLSDLDLRSETAPVAWSSASWPTAHAHPGHDPSSTLVGELHGTWPVDVLEGAALGEAAVLEGPVDSLDLGLGALRLAGTTTYGGTPLAFDLAVDVNAPVIGVPVATMVDAASPPRAFTLSLDLGAVLTWLPWEDAPTDGTWTTADPAVAHTLRHAVRRHAAWHLETSP